jgi:hypothetical protein
VCDTLPKTISVSSTAVVLALLSLPIAAMAEDDVVLLEAVGFALTGSDNAIAEIVDRSNCVFGLQGSGEYGERHVEIFHLNSVDVDRLTIRIFGPGNAGPVEVSLHGETVVYEKKILVQPEYHLPKGAKFLPEADQKSNEYKLTINTAEGDRVNRAWAYIYNNGCHGKKSPF